MPWSKTNYPASLKKLPVAVRNKAIAIANALLKEKKKTAEGKIIDTAIKKAKEIIAKGEKKTAKVSAKKKAKSAAKKKTVTAAAKKTKRAVKSKAKNVAGRKTPKAAKAKTKAPVAVESPVTEKITHGDDLHLIPVEGEIREVRAAEVPKIENVFHHKEEVAFHQENQRIKEAMSSRKNMKRFTSHRGRR